MSTPLNRYDSYRWPAGDIPHGVASGEKSLTEQYGRKRSKSDNLDLAFPYTAHRGEGRLIKRGLPLPSGGSYYAPVVQAGDWPYSGNGSALTSAGWAVKPQNRAYEKFKERALGGDSSMGVLVAERREALGMVTNRVVNLRNSYRSLRRGDFKGFLRNLSVDPKRKHRSVVRTAASEASGLWLEYWFGWSPTVNDLYGLSETLVGPPPSQRYHGFSKVKLPELTTRFNHPSGPVKVLSQSGEYIVRTGADVRVINPNIQLLQQLGLVNPVSVAWEVVPFSFVIDWFTCFGNVLDSFTDFVGTDLSNPYTTRLLKTKGRWDTGTWSPTWTYEYRIARMTRVTSLLRPVATYPRFVNVGTSRTRAATAVSLLVQLFLAK